MVSNQRKLVLVVVDSLKPEMLERAIETGRAPMFKLLQERGLYIPDCVSSFPSLTPVASATIATGTTLDVHAVPSMNWYSRGEQRYVEYGSSWPATRTFGMIRVMFDTVYNMNLLHLNRSTRTIFEQLEDAGLRAACANFLIYRGRSRHKVDLEGLAGFAVDAAEFRHATYGPTELFYGELFHSRDTGCPDTFARPGKRDEASGCVGEYLVRHDLFDFLLFSLPDTDYHAHRGGPHATLGSIAWADHNLQRMMDASGGADAFLEEHAVIMVADHSQTPVVDRVHLRGALSEHRLLQPNDPHPGAAEVAVSPGARSAMIYLLRDNGDERKGLFDDVFATLKTLDGVDLVLWLESGSANVWSTRGTLRFAPGSQYTDLRGQRWDLEGDVSSLELMLSGQEVSSRAYPDALGRCWAALNCHGTGDLLISAAPGYEFVDWGGADHVGGGSHGSLHRGDSLSPLIFCGCGPRSADEKASWGLQDVAEYILSFFDIDAGTGQ